MDAALGEGDQLREKLGTVCVQLGEAESMVSDMSHLYPSLHDRLCE